MTEERAIQFKMSNFGPVGTFQVCYNFYNNTHSPVKWRLHDAVFIALEFQSEELIEVPIGSFSEEDGDDSKNITIKISSRFFKLSNYSNPLEMSDVGEISWS